MTVLTNVHEAIASADRILPGQAAPDGERDPRWQAVIGVGEFVETEPEAVWVFARRWGCYPDEDLRSAIATCVLEHLLDDHFDDLIVRIEQAASEDRLFADTVMRSWPLLKDASRAARFDDLIESIRASRSPNTP